MFVVLGLVASPGPGGAGSRKIARTARGAGTARRAPEPGARVRERDRGPFSKHPADAGRHAAGDQRAGAREPQGEEGQKKREGKQEEEEEEEEEEEREGAVRRGAAAVVAVFCLSAFGVLLTATYAHTSWIEATF